MKLKPQRAQQLWGVDLPYSQVHCIIESRILGDRLSRVFVIVEVAINPLTYRIVKRYRAKFADDQCIQGFLDHAEYRGKDFGYVSCVFIHEYTGERVLKLAHGAARMSGATLVKMHRFVMEQLNLPIAPSPSGRRPRGLARRSSRRTT